MNNCPDPAQVKRSAARGVQQQSYAWITRVAVGQYFLHNVQETPDSLLCRELRGTMPRAVKDELGDIIITCGV